MAKRIASITAVLILAGMYIATFVASVTASEFKSNMFFGCLILTITVPIVLWIFIALYKYAHKNDNNEISLSEMRKYHKRIKNGEDTDKIAKEIEEKYNIYD